MIAERRSNSLVVQAHGAELEAIRRLISGLDVSLPSRRLFIYFAEHARAKQLAAVTTAAGPCSFLTSRATSGPK